MSKDPSYSSWSAMIRRCHRPSHSQYEQYGARGITVCDRWRNSYHAFLLDMGPRPEGHEIGRLDHSGNYEPGNCKWVPEEVNRTDLRTTVWVDLPDGERISQKELKRRLKLNNNQYKQDLKRGLTPSQIYDKYKHRIK
jgi:hypothetical protein